MIIEKMEGKQLPSFGQIKDYLFDHGFEVSARTIQRDMEQIRFEFGIEIKYDRHRNGYYIDGEAQINTDRFLRFLEIVNTAELLTESLKESKDTLQYISFESRGVLRGVEHLKPLLFAIKNHRKLSFLYEKFDTGVKRRYTVRPYLLKEYQNRWYLVGMVGGAGDFRTFGVDRIMELQVKEETFKPRAHKHPARLFENTIGLTYSLNKLEEVVLSFTPLQAKYVKSLPLHKSQEVIRESDKEVLVTLRIIPNYEFRQQLLKLGDSVKVIRPQWLAADIKKCLSAALKRYK